MIDESSSEKQARRGVQIYEVLQSVENAGTIARVNLQQLYITASMFTTTKGLALFRDIQKPSADNTVTVSKQTRNVRDFPAIVVSDTATYQFWTDISYVQQFL